MQKYLLLAATLLATPFRTMAQDDAGSPKKDTYTFTLDNCLNYAFGNSNERQRLKLQEKQAEISTAQARSNRNPDLSLRVGENAQHTGAESDVNFSGSASVNGNVVLYQGGSITNTIKQTEQQEEETRLRTAKYDNSLSIEILNAYLAVLKNEETLKYKKQIVETSKEQAEQGLKKFKAGNLLESDYLVLEAQYAANQTDTLDAHISHTSNLLALKRLMSMDPSANLSLVEPDTTTIDALALLPAQDECITKAMASLPELKLSQSAIDIAETQTDIARSGRRPTISANAGVGTSHRNFGDVGQQLGDNFYQQLGVSLSMPLYDKHQTRNKIAQSRYSKQQAELDLAQTELEVKQTIVNQYLNVQMAYERYKATKQRCNAYREVLHVYNVKFDLGAVVITDLLQQQDKYIGAINDYIQAKYAFILNRKILDVYTGDGMKME